MYVFRDFEKQMETNLQKCQSIDSVFYDDKNRFTRAYSRKSLDRMKWYSNYIATYIKRKSHIEKWNEAQ